MKIAMFIDGYFPRINGVVVSVDSFACELTKLGNQVCVVCPSYTEEQQKKSSYNEEIDDKKASYTIIRIPSSFFIWSKEDRAARLDQWFYLKNKVDEFHPDIIHINTEGNLGFYGRIYALHRCLPYIYTMHTLWEEYVGHYAVFLPEFSSRKIAKMIMRIYLKNASLVIVPTNHIHDVAVRYGVSCPIELLPTGVAEYEENYSKLRRIHISRQFYVKYPQAIGKKILMFAGRIALEKNIAFLFSVFEKLLITNPDIVLLIVGGGSHLDTLKKDLQNKDYADKIIFTGYVKNTDMIYYYRLANIFVFPSKTETQGLVTLEAMRAGLPVVAIGEMGTVDVMQGDHGGFMVHDDVDEFCDKVKLLLEDNEIYKQKVKEGEEWCKQWSMPVLSKKLLSFYADAISAFSQRIFRNKVKKAQ